jgi:hypothetical protein
LFFLPLFVILFLFLLLTLLLGPLALLPLRQRWRKRLDQLVDRAFA